MSRVPVKKYGFGSAQDSSSALSRRMIQSDRTPKRTVAMPRLAVRMPNGRQILGVGQWGFIFSAPLQEGLVGSVPHVGRSARSGRRSFEQRRRLAIARCANEHAHIMNTDLLVVIRGYRLQTEFSASAWST